LFEKVNHLSCVELTNRVKASKNRKEFHFVWHRIWSMPWGPLAMMAFSARPAKLLCDYWGPIATH
jgi:hypothetical protein